MFLVAQRIHRLPKAGMRQVDRHEQGFQRRRLPESIVALNPIDHRRDKLVNRMAADLNHGLRPRGAFFRNSRAYASGQNHNLHRVTCLF